jgi:lysophospholipase L1-like esterase
MLRRRSAISSSKINRAICPSSAYLLSSASDYFTSQVGAAGPDLVPETSIVLIWFNNFPATDNALYSFGDGSSGWFFDQNGSQIYLNLRNPTTSLIACGYPILYGYNKLALTRTSSGSIKVSLNKNTVATVSASPTYISASASSREYVGRAHPSIGSYPANKALPIAWAYLTREATDQELLDWSDMGVNDVFHMHPNILADGYLNIHTRIEDWSGTGVLNSLVGSRVLTPTGNPTKVNLEEETVYTVPSWAYSNSLKTLSINDRCTFADINMMSAATKISGLLTDSIAAFGNYRELSLFTGDGYTLLDEMVCNQAANPQFIDGYGLSSGYKSFIIRDGLRTQRGSGPYYGSGFTCSKIRVPTSTPIQFLREERPAKRIVVVGDSISVGDASTIPSRDGWTTIARRNGCKLTTAGWGTASFYSMAYQASWMNTNADRIAALCDGYQSNVVWFSLGTNDYALGLWGGNTTNFGNCCAAFWDAINLRRPDVQIIAQLPILRGTEGTLPLFRAAEANAAVGRAFVTVVDASTWTGITLADGIHPNNAGYIVYEGYSRPYMGY